MKNKKGTLLSDAPFEVIMGVAVVALIITLMVKLFAPTYSESDIAAESYFEQLEEAVALADEGKVASFFILDNGDDELDFYLIYFGDAVSLSYGEGILYDKFGVGGIDFARSDYDKNGICVCYWSGVKAVCKYCMNLDSSAESNTTVKVGEAWLAKEVGIIKIKKGDRYGFNFEE